MLELLFIVALIAWAVVGVLQYLAGLAAAPTLLAAAVLVPAIAWWRVRALTRLEGLEFVRTARHPLPPDRFYWPVARRHLGRRAVVCTIATIAAWPIAMLSPAEWSADRSSLAGWLAGAAGIFSLAEVCTALWLYVRASQRFDRLAPRAVGWLRRGLYLISDNHEFLGEEPLPREKRRRESVY
jgi:hypothetical protein